MGTINKLSAVTVRRTSKPGYYGDGAGLWLQVSRSGTKSWVFRFTLDGRSREMGLGPIHTVSLAKAREKAARCREQLLDGVDPIEARKAERSTRLLEAAKIKTFKECALAYIEAHRSGWKNPKHAAQWESTLVQYAFPVFGDLPVSEVDTGLVMRVLEPIWQTKTETASRVRGRIESILSWAKVRRFRTGENPARWRGHLDTLLPKRTKVRRVEHHPALPYQKAPEFMAALREQEGTSARALEFAILTACRTAEVIGAKFSEFDLVAGLWVIPAERMKARREHRVALSKHAVEIIAAMQKTQTSDYVFPSPRVEEKPISNMAMLQTLKRMGCEGLTVHGFRSTFRDWCSEQTSYPSEVAEMALAHVVSDKVEAAYRRGDLVTKRRKLMQAWANYLNSPRVAAEVVPLKRNVS